MTNPQGLSSQSKLATTVGEKPDTQSTYTTRQMCEKLHFEINTPRASLCVRGHFNGIVPIKLPNGRLLWPKDKVDALLRGEAK